MTEPLPADCAQILDALQDVLRDEASPEMAEAVRRHLEECGPCRHHAGFERRFLELLRKCDREQLPADLRARILAALRQDPR